MDEDHSKSHSPILVEFTRGHVVLRLASRQLIRYGGEQHLPAKGSPGFVLHSNEIEDVTTGTTVQISDTAPFLAAFALFADTAGWRYEVV